MCVSLAHVHLVIINYTVVINFPVYLRRILMIEFRLEWDIITDKKARASPNFNLLGRKELFISDDVTSKTSSFHLNSLIDTKKLQNGNIMKYINGILLGFQGNLNGIPKGIQYIFYLWFANILLAFTTFYQHPNNIPVVSVY